MPVRRGWERFSCILGGGFRVFLDLIDAVGRKVGAGRGMGSGIGAGVGGWGRVGAGGTLGGCPGGERRSFTLGRSAGDGDGSDRPGAGAEGGSDSCCGGAGGGAVARFRICAIWM